VRQGDPHIYARTRKSKHGFRRVLALEHAYQKFSDTLFVELCQAAQMVDVEKGTAPLEGGVLAPREVDPLRNVFLCFTMFHPHRQKMIQQPLINLGMSNYFSARLHEAISSPVPVFEYAFYNVEIGDTIVEACSISG
jgi:hypothetical protein